MNTRSGYRQQHRSEIGKAKPRNLGFAIWPELLKVAERDAAKFNCSLSFVMNTALSVTLGVDVGEKYWTPKEEYRKPKRGKLVHFRKRKTA